MKTTCKLLTVFLLILLAGCKTVIPTNPQSTPIPTPEENTTIFKMADDTTPINLDPLYAFTAKDAQFSTAFYEGLVTYDPFYLTPIQGVAWKWELSENKKVYSFYLRDNALYNNGDMVLANDFKNAWLRIIDPKANAQYSLYLDIIKGAYDYRTGKNPDPDSVGIKVISDHLLEVELEKPASHFLKLLCHMTFVPIHPSYMDKNDWNNNTTLISNGPYQYSVPAPDKIVMIKNNYYWDKANVGIEEIDVKLTTDFEETTKLFNEGKYHWISPFIYNQVKNINYLKYYPVFSLKFYYFKTKNAPWDNPQVRRGLALLLPWDKIRTPNEVYFTDTIIPKLTDYPPQKGINQDITEGLRLLEEAGYPAGKGLPALTIKIPQSQEDEELSNLMQTTWQEKLGLQVQIQKIVSADFFEELTKDDYDLSTMIWIGDYADPLSMLQIWMGDSNINNTGFKNQQFDNIINEVMSLEDDKARYELLSTAEKILLDEAILLPIRQNPAINLFNDDIISGWYPNILDIHPFMYFNFIKNKVPQGLVFRAAPLFLPHG